MVTNDPSPLPSPSPRAAAGRGQGLLEFGLILPLLLLLILGIIEAGRMLAIYSSLSSAGKQSVRYGAVAGDYDVLTPGEQPFYTHCQGMRDTARRVALFVPLADDAISIRYERGVGGLIETIGVCAPGAVTPTVALTSTAPLTVRDGDRLVISVTAPYRPIVPIVPLPEMPMTFAAARTIFTVIVGPTPTRPPEPDLRVTKSDFPDPVFPDDPLVYAITVSNLSGGDAVDIIITDTLPIQIRTYPRQQGNPDLRWEPPPQWLCADPPSPQTFPIQIRCTYLLPLKAGASVVLPITVTAPTTPGITITNTVIVASAVTETITNNNFASQSTVLVNGADMVVNKTASSEPVYYGVPMTYTILAHNNGPQNEGQGGNNQVIITDTLPAGMTLLSVSFPTGGGATWQTCTNFSPIRCVAKNNVNLAPGGNMDPITIVALPPNVGHGGQFSNTVFITLTTTTDPKPRNNTTYLTSTLSMEADLAVGKWASVGAANGGETFSFTVRVTNTAGALVSGIVVTDTLGPVAYSAAGANWNCNPAVGASGGQVVCSYSGSLLPGQATPNLVFTVAAPPNSPIGSVANTVIVGSPQPDPNPANNTAQASVAISNCDINTASTTASSVSVTPATIQTDLDGDGNPFATVRVELRNSCNNQLVTTNQSVTLSSTRPVNDTINHVGGSGPTGVTTTGIIEFRVTSNAGGQSTYRASANGGPDLNNTATVTYYDCVTGGAGPGGGGNQNVAYLFTNNTPVGLRLIQLSLNWPQSGGRAVTSVVFGAATIWSGSSSANPFEVSGGGFAGNPSDRDLANGASRALTFNFNYNVQAGSGNKTFTLTSTWEETATGNQCTITTTVTR